MTIVSSGYEGQLTEDKAAVWAANHGAAPHILGGLGATVTSAVNRTVQIGTGKAQGWCVLDEVTEAETLTLDSASATTPRWDAIVLHRDWQAGTTGETTLEVVKGSVNSATPVYPSTMDASPGTVADHPLWLVPVTNTGAGTPVPAAGDIYAAGSTLYWPRSSWDGLEAAQLPYGQTVIKYEAAGIQSRHLLRRGSAGSEIFEDLNSPEWQKVDLFSGLTAGGTGQDFRMRVAAGHLELAGEVTRVDTTPFGISTGDGIDFATVPTLMRPVRTRWVGTSWGPSVVQVRYDDASGRIKARIYNDSSKFAFFDGIRFPLNDLP